MSGKTAKKARLRARVERGGGAEHLEPPVYSIEMLQAPIDAAP